MSLSVEQLMQPRYRVVINFPQPPYNEESDEHKFIKGDILKLVNVNGVQTYLRTGRLGHMSVGVPCIKNPEKYPEVFEPLPWWAERQPEDMPLFLKSEDGVHQCRNWEIKDGVIKGEIESLNGSWTHWWVVANVMYFFEPASKQEYLTYKQNNP